MTTHSKVRSCISTIFSMSAKPVPVRRLRRSGSRGEAETTNLTRAVSREGEGGEGDDEKLGDKAVGIMLTRITMQ